MSWAVVDEDTGCWVLPHFWLTGHCGRISRRFDKHMYVRNWPESDAKCESSYSLMSTANVFALVRVNKNHVLKTFLKCSILLLAERATLAEKNERTAFWLLKSVEVGFCYHEQINCDTKNRGLERRQTCGKAERNPHVSEYRQILLHLLKHKLTLLGLFWL